jgi:anti-anti-sigma factor
MAQFDWSTDDDGRDVLRVAGEVDLGVVDELLDHALERLVRSGAGIDLDLGGVTFIDSSGIGALIRLRNEAVKGDTSLRLRNVSAPVVRLLQVTGLSGSFDLQPAG